MATSSSSSSSSLTPEESALFRVYKVTGRMLQKRGYTVADSVISIDGPTFKSTMCADGAPDRSRMLIMASRAVAAAPSASAAATTSSSSSSSSSGAHASAGTGEEKIMVLFEDGNVAAKTIKAASEQAQTKGVSRVILVIGGKMTTFARSAMDEVMSIARFESFREEELRVDITEHELVPEHRVLRPDEKAALLARYKLSETKLPRIQASDPVARFYGMQRGQVVKIIRPSQTAGRYVTYRIVM